MASGLAGLYNKLVQLLQTAPRGALSITGILGLALLVYGYLQLRDTNRAEQQRREQQARERQRVAGTPAGAGAAAAPRAAAPSSAAAAPAAASSPATSASPAPRASAGASATPLGRAVAAQLAGAKRVTLSIPGVLLAESSPAQLQESASVQLEALEAVREMARVSDVYLLAHVEDDVGEAVVAGALEAAGLLGAGAGQVAPHHLLCCSTLDGKVGGCRGVYGGGVPGRGQGQEEAGWNGGGGAPRGVRRDDGREPMGRNGQQGLQASVRTGTIHCAGGGASQAHAAGGGRQAVSASHPSPAAHNRA